MKIYALMWGELVLYVGKTTMNLKERAYAHKYDTNTTTSKYIPEYIDWDIVLVDEVSDEDGTKWEQHYYDELMPLYNRYRPGQTILEYNRANGYMHQKKWQNSKEEWNSYMREYRKKKRAQR
jgi:hypothetical protein